MDIESDLPDAKLLGHIAHYITDLLKTFGVIVTDNHIGFPMKGYQHSAMVS